MWNKVTSVKCPVEPASNKHIGGIIMICVGIDVAKDKHDCFILNSEGEVLADVFTIPNNAEGFDTLLQAIRRCASPEDKIKVGLEATGHYSYNILGFLLDKGIQRIFPFAAACIKPPLLESQKQRLFLLGITEKYRKQDMSSFVISSQCNNCMAYQAKYKRKTATAK